MSSSKRKAQGEKMMVNGDKKAMVHEALELKQACKCTSFRGSMWVEFKVQIQQEQVQLGHSRALQRLQARVAFSDFSVEQRQQHHLPPLCKDDYTMAVERCIIKDCKHEPFLRCNPAALLNHLLAGDDHQYETDADFKAAIVAGDSTNLFCSSLCVNAVCADCQEVVNPFIDASRLLYHNCRNSPLQVCPSCQQQPKLSLSHQRDRAYHLHDGIILDRHSEHAMPVSTCGYLFHVLTLLQLKMHAPGQIDYEVSATLRNTEQYKQKAKLMQCHSKLNKQMDSGEAVLYHELSNHLSGRLGLLEGENFDGSRHISLLVPLSPQEGPVVEEAPPSMYYGTDCAISSALTSLILRAPDDKQQQQSRNQILCLHKRHRTAPCPAVTEEGKPTRICVDVESIMERWAKLSVAHGGLLGLLCAACCVCCSLAPPPPPAVAQPKNKKKRKAKDTTPKIMQYQELSKLIQDMLDDRLTMEIDLAENKARPIELSCLSILVGADVKLDSLAMPGSRERKLLQSLSHGNLTFVEEADASQSQPLLPPLSVEDGKVELEEARPPQTPVTPNKDMDADAHLDVVPFADGDKLAPTPPASGSQEY